MVKRFINADDYAGTGQGFVGYNMFAYCNNSPVICIDSSGNALDTIWDVVSFGMSFAEVVANPNDPVAWFSLAADAVCMVIPGLTGGGGIVRVVANADKLADAAKLADDVVDAGKAISSSLDTGNEMHRLYMKFFEGGEFFANKTLGKTFDDVISRLRPDALDKINNIIYELKPYNKDSFLKAINQVNNYLNTIGGDLRDWYVVIDMYFDSIL